MIKQNTFMELPGKQTKEVPSQDANLLAQTVRRTLRLLMQQHGIKETDLAKQTTISQPTVHRLLAGATPDPGSSTLRTIAQFFNITLGQLVGDEPLITTADGAPQTRHPLIKVPLIPWERAHEWQKLLENYVPSNWQYWTSINQPVNAHSFALVINSRHLPTPFIYQAVIVLDPYLKQDDGNYVLVYRISDQSTTIKKISFEGNDKWLISLNQKINALYCGDDFIICGTIIQANVPIIAG